MFITPALAQTTSAPGGSNIILQLMPFILIFAIMYFLIIRPQQKRLKAHREMVSNVKRGDTVVTAGGLVGKVASVVDDNEIRVDIADGVRVSVVRSTLSEVRPKGEVRGAEKSAKQADKQSEKKSEAIEDRSEVAEDDEAAAPAAQVKTTNGSGAAKKSGGARKSRSASSGTGAKKTASSGSSKTGAGGGSKAGTSRTRRSRAKGGNGSSSPQSKETGSDNV